MEAHSSQVNKRREEGAEGRCALASGRMERFSASSVMRGGGGPGATAYGQTAYLARAKSASNFLSFFFPILFKIVAVNLFYNHSRAFAKSALAGGHNHGGA